MVSPLQSPHENGGVTFKWDKSCRNAFEIIKKYLLSLLVLGAPIPSKFLILYIAA